MVEIKNMMLDMKKSFDGLISRLDTIEKESENLKISK